MARSSRVTSQRIQELLTSQVRRSRDYNNDPRDAGYLRFSNKRLQNETSIEDQSREISRFAEEPIAPAYQFADCGVSGAEPGREGLCAMLEAAAKGEFSTLYLYSMSRLARECVLTMGILKWLVYALHVRVRSVVEGIDTAMIGWEVSATVIAMFAEQQLREISANVSRGQKGALLSLFSVGEFCFGYTSVPDPEGAFKRCRGGVVARRVYAVDDEQAKWVRQIFYWFVTENRGLSWIARKLNKIGAPRDHRATTPHWTHATVRRLLRNPKYIGIWSWGRSKNLRSPITGIKFRELRSDEEIAEWTREFTALRIVDDATFHQAHCKLKRNAAMMADCRRPDGQFGGAAGPIGVPRHLLQGLLRCEECGSPYYVGGAHGKYLWCRGRRDGFCSQSSRIPRALAEKHILDAIGAQMLSNSDWIEVVLDNAHRLWSDTRNEVPNTIAEHQRRLSVCEERSRRLVRRVEDGDEEIPELSQRLRELRREADDLKAEIFRQQQTLTILPQDAPNREWIASRLTELNRILRSQTPAAAVQLRDLLEGSILVAAIDVHGRVRKNFRLELRLRLRAALKDLSSTNDGQCHDTVVPLTLIVERPTIAKDQMAQTWKLIGEGKQAKDIAVLLGVSRSRMTAIYKDLERSNPCGLTRKELHSFARSKRPAEPTMAVRLLPEIMDLFEKDALIDDIAKKLGCCDATVKKAIAIWHTEHGLPIPDGRTRRKGLEFKTRTSTERANA